MLKSRFMKIIAINVLLFLNALNVNSQNTGFTDFENGGDGEVIRSTIPGLVFSTTNGYDWIFGDWRTGLYNGKYPSGAYTSNGNIFAWLGPNQGAGRIDFTQGTATFLTIWTSTYSGLVMDAYDSSGKKIGSSAQATSNVDTGNMTRLTVYAPGMIYVIIHDTGNYWLIDDLATDAPGVPGQPRLGSLAINIGYYDIKNRIICVAFKISNWGDTQASEVFLTINSISDNVIYYIYPPAEPLPLAIPAIDIKDNATKNLFFQYPAASCEDKLFKFSGTIICKDASNKEYSFEYTGYIIIPNYEVQQRDIDFFK